MLTREESGLLNDYFQKDPRLKVLFQRLEEEHRAEVSRISHEIRNPVTLINSYLQLTRSRYPQVEEFSTWKPLTENMDFLKNLLEELSRYNHAGSLHPETFSLTALLQDICRDASMAWAPLTVSFQKSTEVPMVFADKTKLKEAVLNLIRNGAEAIRDQKDGRLALSVSFQDGWFTIRVTNNGPQIDPEHLTDIFDPFISFKKDGTGLGLPIVRSIAQAHGGTVSVTSTPEITSFFLRFPMAAFAAEAACAHADTKEE
ncbi:MAG TPA: HAMP domain-containing histidine kinase [Candidatus Pullilachnospira intestinigallinarum]|nr:HAMP domain-containing histidine kinase [Candidatus Pullilachnospira intestinigallinarum]